MISMQRTLAILTILLSSAASAETYDVVVVGGSSMGVAAAAEAADCGAKVLLVEANSYLGVDLAGKLCLKAKDLRRDRSRPCGLASQLARAMVDPVGDLKVVTPLRIKQLCDRQLLDRHIPFRTWTYPCGILKDKDGNVAGIVVASRNGFETIPAKTLVDATEFGRLAEKAGSTFTPFASGKTAFRRGLVTDQPKKCEWRPFACEMTDFSARGFAAAEQAARDATWTPATLDAADTLLLEENRRLVQDARYVWTVGLFSAQTDLMKAIAAGQAVGRAAAEAARKRPSIGATERFMGASETVTCDVLVAGAGTGGAPAAIAAARSGLKTIVCDPLYRMGGVMTDGLIDCYCYGLRIGFTTEIDKGVAALKASVRGVGKAEWFRRAVREAGGEAWFGALVVGLEKSGDKVTSATVVFADGSLCRVRAKCTIDATGNADLAALAGEETEFIDGTELSLQGAGSTAKVLGRTYLNTDCGFVDDTDAEDLMNFTLRARQSMGAYAWDQSQIVNSRERRRLRGVAYVTPQDVIMNRTYPDVIARTHSNFDTHGQTVGAQFFIEAPHAAQPITVNLPYGCILPKKTDGLLVIGLGMSAHRDAMPILRMQPDVQNQGFAAGTAAALAVKGGVAPRAIDVKALQRKMIDAGILDESVLSMKDSFPLPDATLAQAAATVDDGYKGLAELLTDPARAIPLLKSGKGLPSAHVLAMLGDGTRAQQVADAVAASAWDAGWNYRGMDQFGRSVSWVDSYLIALGRAKASCALEPLVKKASELAVRDAYSHFRAVALCAEGLNDRAAVPALSRLLALPGVGGHAQRPIVEAGVVPIPEYAYWESGNRGIADRERSDCLRELCLARALFNLGDDEAKSGERTLRAYSADPRKAYANHAKKALSKPALVLRFDDNKPLPEQLFSRGSEIDCRNVLRAKELN